MGRALVKIKSGRDEVGRTRVKINSGRDEVGRALVKIKRVREEGVGYWCRLKVDIMREAGQ